MVKISMQFFGGRTSSSGMSGGSQQAAGPTGGQTAYSDIASSIDSARFRKMSGDQQVMDTPYGRATISGYTDAIDGHAYAIDVRDANGNSVITNDRGHRLQTAKDFAKQAIKSIYNPDKPTSLSQLKSAGAEGYQRAVRVADSISAGSTLTITTRSGNTYNLVKGPYSSFKVTNGGSLGAIGSVEVAYAMMDGKVSKFKPR